MAKDHQPYVQASTSVKAISWSIVYDNVSTTPNGSSRYGAVHTAVGRPAKPLLTRAYNVHSKCFYLANSRAQWTVISD